MAYPGSALRRMVRTARPGWACWFHRFLGWRMGRRSAWRSEFVAARLITLRPHRDIILLRCSTWKLTYKRWPATGQSRNPVDSTRATADVAPLTEVKIRPPSHTQSGNSQQLTDQLQTSCASAVCGDPLSLVSSKIQKIVSV